MKKLLVLSAVSLLLVAAPVARSAPLPAEPQRSVAGPLDPILDAVGSTADTLLCQRGVEGYPDGDPYDGDIYGPYANRLWDCPPYDD